MLRCLCKALAYYSSPLRLVSIYISLPSLPKRRLVELYRQIRQLCIIVGTSGSILLENLINDFILTASILSSLIYLI